MKFGSIKLRMSKENLKRVCKEHKICLLAFLIPLILWLIIAMYMKYAPFGGNSLLLNDAVHQYYPLFGQYRDRLLSGHGIFYSAGGGLGFNFYALWTYYLSSPLNLLILLFPAASLDSAMNLLIIFKIALSGMTFAYYLGIKGKKNTYKILPFSCGYALSTFVIGYCYNIMWLDCVALFPLILAGQERLMKEGRWKLYTVSLALSLWCSFYISFMICLFLVIWFLFYEFSSIKELCKKGILFAATSLLGAGLSCVVLLPAYMGIVQIQGGSAFPEFDWMGQFMDIFAGKEGGIFAFSDPISINNQVAYNANLYCGVFVLGLVILFFLAKDVKGIRKMKVAWLLVLFVLSLNNQALNYIWHGFHYQVGIPNRFVFLLNFLLLFISYGAFRRLKSYRLWQILISGGVSLLIYGALYFLQREQVSWTMLFCTMGFVLAYTILEAISRKKEKTIIIHILIAGMCLELCANAIAGSKMQAGVYIDTFYRSKADTQKMSDAIPYDQFRTELSNPTVKNEGMAYNLRGTGLFSSTTNAGTINLLHNIGYSTSSNSYIPAGASPVLNMLFGIKNYIILQKDANRLDYRYEKKSTIGDAELYENEEVLPVAYLCDKDVKDWTSMDSNFFVNQEELLKLMTGKKYSIYTEQDYELKETHDIEVESLDEHQQFTYLSAKGARNDHIVFEAVADRDEDLYLRLEARYSNKTLVLINDEVHAFKDMSSSFYHIGDVKKGDKITVKIGIQENSPTFGMVSMAMYAYHQEALVKAYQELSSGALKVTDWKEGYIEGNVDVGSAKKTLFTTIPYDKGWSIYVDGKRQKTQTVHHAFLMIELKEGNHKVEFRYTVPGLYTGFAVSLGCLVIFLIILFHQKQKKHKRIHEEENEQENEA